MLTWAMLSWGGGVTQHTQKTKNAQNSTKMTLVDFHLVELPPPPNSTCPHTDMYRLMVITLSVW